MNKKLEIVFFPVILDYMKNLKKEIISEGLIPTADEMIERVEFIIEQNRIAKTNNHEELLASRGEY